MKDTTRIGRTMVYTAWIAAALILSWGFAQLLERQHNPNTDIGGNSAAGVKEVVLKRNRFGHYVATGRINGMEVEFLLDTGASNVSIPSPLAMSLNLRPGVPMLTQTANGVITTYSTTLNSVALGDVELTNVRASINPNSDMGSVLLGMAFLKHLELVQRGDTLTIRQ